MEIPATSVIFGPDGYIVSVCPKHGECLKEVVPYDARYIKDSPDGEYHVCTAPYPIAGLGRRIRCFFRAETA